MDKLCADLTDEEIDAIEEQWLELVIYLYG